MIAAPTLRVHRAIPIQPLREAQTYRACQLCASHRTVAGELHCACVLVAPPGRTVPVDIARGDALLCGPDADYLHFGREDLSHIRQLVA